MTRLEGLGLVLSCNGAGIMYLGFLCTRLVFETQLQTSRVRYVYVCDVIVDPYVTYPPALFPFRND
jgi:hypothetical protein